MEYKDYYKILGIARSADTTEIKQAYRKLARQYHPDVNPGDAQAEARFKEVNEAYEVLSNPESRQQYDELGANWQQHARQQSRNGGFRGGFDGFAQSADTDGGFGGFSDFFRAFFGGGTQFGGGAYPHEGEAIDLKAQLSISLQEAYAGGPKVIKLGDEQFRISLKPGAQEGQTLRLKGKGKQSPTGHRGDLYLVLRIQPDPYFERRGDDLHTEQSVDVFTATLGGTFKVRTLGGEQLQIQIKPGTQGGTTVRLRGKGMPRKEDPAAFGDLYLTLNIQVPTTLTDEQRKLWEQLRERS